MAQQEEYLRVIGIQMTELSEGVQIGITALENEPDYSCDKKDEKKPWKSRVNKHNSQEACTGTRLYDNMKAVASAHEKKGLGVVPNKRARTNWKLKMVTSTFFPVQAHHLIPKNYLPDHRVCVWLAIKYDSNPKYKLKYDSNYDTDDESNGYCMPYATPLKEWKSGDASEKLAIALSVMDKVGVQLHQGSHAKLLDPAKLEEMAGEQITPDIIEVTPGGDSDELEEAQIHSPGYLNGVKDLLNVIDEKAHDHVEICKPCKANKKGSKTLVLPAENIASLMHQVSKIVKILVQGKILYVSNFGYFHAYLRNHIEIKGGKVHAKTSRAALRSAIINR